MHLLTRLETSDFRESEVPKVNQDSFKESISTLHTCSSSVHQGLRDPRYVERTRRFSFALAAVLGTHWTSRSSGIQRREGRSRRSWSIGKRSYCACLTEQIPFELQGMTGSHGDIGPPGIKVRHSRSSFSINPAISRERRANKAKAKRANEVPWVYLAIHW